MRARVLGLLLVFAVVYTAARMTFMGRGRIWHERAAWWLPARH